MRDAKKRGVPHNRIWAALITASLALSGCSEGIETSYGHRSGLLGGDSVNGTAVLGRMFSAAGHHVTSATRLSPRVYDTADCIVWAPDDFKPPSVEVRQWFNAWWRHGDGRTLIYIGRDYDAAPAYWRAVQGAAPKSQHAEIMRRLAKDQNAYLSERGQMPDDEDCQWFTARGKRNQRQVNTLSGLANWISDVDEKKVDIELNGRLIPPLDAEVLVESNGDAIVSREEMANDGCLILVVNGSFLLNVPLVNQENRKLAARLIDEIGPAPQEVVFLESGPNGPRIWEDEPPEQARTGLEIVGVWPFNVIFLQLGALGLIFCYSRFPIFGRPRPLAAPHLSDFGRHIAALAALLQRTGDRVFASNEVARYQQTVRREPGRFRRSAAPGDRAS
ncbi:MAG TPA: hypothetical protein VFI31_26140 [Pirellulales bacterium]|nr:hypothetical protein [Pirellulales bacterium]